MEGTLVIGMPNDSKELVFGVWLHEDDDDIATYTLTATEAISMNGTVYSLYDHANDEIYTVVSEYGVYGHYSAVAAVIHTKDGLIVDISRSENFTSLRIAY